MNEVCITSVAFREPYVTHSINQEKRLRELGFDGFINWYRDKLPMKDRIHEDTSTLVSKFQESLYGFKPHAIYRCVDFNYKKVIWLDPSVLPTCSMQVLIDALDHHPIIVRPGEEPLTKMCNAKAKNWFGVTDEDIKNERTVAGTVYGFNFTHPKAVEVFNLWKRAEEEGIFGTQDDFMAGHWSDEACIALAMHKCGVEQHYVPQFKYLNQKNL